MTKIKLCGLKRIEDIEAANKLKPEYVGFVFAEKSKRYVSPVDAAVLRKGLLKDIITVGVFVNAAPETVAKLCNDGIIGIAQLHGKEDEEYIKTLRTLTDKPISKAFRVDTKEDVERAVNSSADYILLDSGEGGTGETFDWSLLSGIERPFFLAGGLNPCNVKEAVKRIKPYAVDVSSGIETDGFKDPLKMEKFVSEVRNI